MLFNTNTQQLMEYVQCKATVEGVHTRLPDQFGL